MLRPTTEEIIRIGNHFREKVRQKIPMPDLIEFAIETTMRTGEIINLKWTDMNQADRTIMSSSQRTSLISVSIAPYACVRNSYGHLEGTIIAASWDSNMGIGHGMTVGIINRHG